MAKAHAMGPSAVRSALSCASASAAVDLDRSSRDSGALAPPWFSACLRHRSRDKARRPRLTAELRRLIQQISRDNLQWGAPRIHGEHFKLVISISQATVANHMVRDRKPPSHSWLTFLRNHAGSIAAINLFIVSTISFRLRYGVAILNPARRQMVHVSATCHPTAEWLARQLIEAYPWETAPKHLTRDCDYAYGEAFRKKRSVMDIRDGPAAPRSRWQDGYVKRVIGLISRELLHHVIVTGERHLRGLLRD